MTDTYPSKSEENRKAKLECSSCGRSVTVRDYQQSKVVCENCGRVLKEGISRIEGLNEQRSRKRDMRRKVELIHPLLGPFMIRNSPRGLTIEIETAEERNFLLNGEIEFII